MRPIGDWSMSMILSICSSPSMRSCGRGAFAGVVELARDGLVERVDQQRRLAAAGDAGDAGEQPQRNFRRDVLQVVAAGVDHLDGAAMVRRPPLGDRDRQFAGEIFAGQRIRIAHDVLRACPAPRCGRHACRRRGRCRARNRPAEWRPRHARPRSRYCRGRAAASAFPAAAHCRAGAGRSRARPAHRARRSAPSRSARRAGCAGFRRRDSVPEARASVR